MRRILVDHARSAARLKRGGDRQRIVLEHEPAISVQSDVDVLGVDEALQRLEAIDKVQARIIELRFFGGLTVAEVAEVLGISKRKVEYEWAMSRAWLRRELTGEGQA